MTSRTGLQLRGWIRVYCDASILRALADINAPTANQSISTLDHVLIVCGRAGDKLDLIISLIEIIQRKYFTPTSYVGGADSHPLTCINDALPLQNTNCHIPVLSDFPSVLAFQSHLVTEPFILRNYARNWPALNEHPWYSSSYLRSVSGPGRIVPVEIGKDYRSEKWTQGLINWDDFLASLDLMDQPHLPPPSETIYLAQHDLLLQFPGLRADITIPDYVYATVDPNIFPNHRPPGNDDELAISAWLGPGGTISPAHTDPYFNTFVQVVGCKTVWLAPPEFKEYMYPYPMSTHSGPTSINPSMLNTSRVDVFSSENSKFPNFQDQVVPKAQGASLNPGDLLFIPPGWWHAMRSETTSFSVSMWF
ncbi:hypothetical protein BDZ94DRAFT_1275560 [Collybia nuda]|uniref:JmjC domain-containing protein n=1 Tax=Collybia nuda TaxID=64659 RepID=A0A9P6C8N9_9AGAR|nr:hypothetical protein BDZ94DRAFT_1275560 [Collybia nuda]